MKKKVPYLVLTILLFTFSIMISRSFRVSQIPNGNVGSCANCHVNPGGGGSRNAFGTEVGTSFLSGGNVVWGPELASIDSDGDGFTNGEELQDPEGTWLSGRPAPGEPSLVTNPGDASSVPSVTSVKNNGFLAQTFKLMNNYPNPFNPQTRIDFSIAEASDVTIDIYNSLGEHIDQIVNSSFGPGTFSAEWNVTNLYGAELASGMYIYRMNAISDFSGKVYSESKRMLYLK